MHLNEHGVPCAFASQIKAALLCGDPVSKVEAMIHSNPVPKNSRRRLTTFLQEETVKNAAKKLRPAEGKSLNLKEVHAILDSMGVSRAERGHLIHAISLKMQH